MGTVHQFMSSTRAKGRTQPKRQRTCFWWILWGGVSGLYIDFGGRVGGNGQVCDGNGGEADGFHAAVGVC